MEAERSPGAEEQINLVWLPAGPTQQQGALMYRKNEVLMGGCASALTKWRHDPDPQVRLPSGLFNPL